MSMLEVALARLPQMVGTFRVVGVYLGETKRRNRDGSTVAYLQLAHSERHPVNGVPSAKVIHGTVIPEGTGPSKRLSISGFAGFGPPCRQHRVRTGVKTQRPQRSEDERS